MDSEVQRDYQDHLVQWVNKADPECLAEPGSPVPGDRMGLWESLVQQGYQEHKASQDLLVSTPTSPTTVYSWQESGEQREQQHITTEISMCQ